MGFCLSCSGYTGLEGRAAAHGCPGTGKCSSPGGLFEGVVIPHVSSPTTPQAGLSMESYSQFAVIQVLSSFPLAQL